MTDLPDDYPSKEKSQDLIEDVLRGSVESGTVEVTGKSLDEIADQLMVFMGDFGKATENDVRVEVLSDYRKTLLSKAQAEAEAGHVELAITLYAIWIEHFVNRALANALMRMGHGSDISTPLVKGVSLALKTTALWRIAGLPEISQEDRKLLTQVTEFRNAFVHYKWTTYSRQEHDQRNQRLLSVAAKCEQLVSSLTGLEQAVLWDGREQEIVQYMREGIRGVWETRWGGGDVPD